VRTPGDTLVYDLVPYEEHMEELYAHASVAVCRAGAVTVAELTAAGLPAVLVPLPGAPGDHQTRNADTLVAAGAAVAIPDAQLDGARLAATLDGLLTEPDRLATMRDAARSLARVDAASKVADLVDEVARAR
jgi:UDP-N-acetylglucosamine--N-acetylmuramyl-(pentapeptide) pyrophosphoryl-undecaprenol N-acetylglucosamine transferase